MVRQVSSQLLAPKLDRFGVQARDTDERADGRRVGVIGKRGDVPAALRLTHTTEQQVDLVVVARKLRVSIGFAGLTLAATHTWFRC
jgi:hypothetical protein